MKSTIAIAALFSFAGAAAAQTTLGFTSFEASPQASQITSNAVVGGGGLINEPGLTFAGGGGEIGFQTFWRDTRSTGEGGPVDGGESGDFIGVTDFTPEFGTPFTDGDQGYQWNDPDGAIDLVLDTVDATGFTGVTITFDLWIEDTSYESTDLFEVQVNGSAVLTYGELDLEGNSGAWLSLSVAGVDNAANDITFIGDTNSGSENFWIDNVEITGIPTPGAAALLGVAGLAGLRRRRA